MAIVPAAPCPGTLPPPCGAQTCHHRFCETCSSPTIGQHLFKAAYFMLEKLGSILTVTSGRCEGVNSEPEQCAAMPG